MTNFPYTEGLPNPPDKPNQDVARMQINSTSIPGIIAQDHIGFGFDNGGYHTVIHSIPTNNPSPPTTYPPAGSPAAISGVEQIYPLLYQPNTIPPSAADTQLFARTGVGGISQLTGNNAIRNGWCWCGGILLQWGFVNVTTTTTGMVTFTDATGGIPFPRNCFNITTSITGNNASNTSRVTVSTNPTVTSFNWTYTNGPGTSGFYWMAIGN
jgi:hypothetical protein